MDFGVLYKNISINCNNTSAINLTKNPVHHSKAKNIEIWHDFIRDHVVNGNVSVKFVSFENQLTDIFTKPLDKMRY